MSATLSTGLYYLKLILESLQPRIINLGVQDRPLVLVWTDAMWEPGKPAMMASVISSPRSHKTWIFWAIVDDNILKQLLPRKQQIGALRG